VAEDNNPTFIIGLVILGLVLVAYGLVTVLGLTRASQLDVAAKRMTDIDNEIKADKKLSDTLEKYNGLAAADENLVRIINSRLLFLPGWKAVKGAVPKDIQLTSVTVTNDLTYRLSGESKSVASIAAFSHVLEDKLEATSVIPSSINKKPDTDRFTFGMSFDIAKSNETLP
jgi:hypothetical protein